MGTYLCDLCGWGYNPEVGDADGGIPAGTAFENLPDHWECPLCGVDKTSFVKV
ncbi:rubredoxin [Treponema pallidum]|uniref:rubredoxin n=1 Tax=Treponema pallidum TaxID=160 RepID=UPI0035D4E26E